MIKFFNIIAPRPLSPLLSFVQNIIYRLNIVFKILIDVAPNNNVMINTGILSI